MWCVGACVWRGVRQYLPRTGVGGGLASCKQDGSYAVTLPACSAA